jgi:hypothetical protein
MISLGLDVEEEDVPPALEPTSAAPAAEATPSTSAMEEID